MEVAAVIASGHAPSGPAGGGEEPPADPVAAAELTEQLVRGLEGIGAAVESERLGEAFFAVDGLRGIHGGDTAGVLDAAWGAAGPSARIAVAPTRFAAFIAATQSATAGRAPVVSPHGLRAFLDDLPVSSLRDWVGLPEHEADGLLETLTRLGVGTLGALASLAPGPLADRFGRPGLRALRLARGEDEPLRPRRPYTELAEEIELPEGTAGPRLDRALDLLVDRLLASPRRRGRTVLALRLGARLSDGAGWSVEQGLGRPTASARVLRSVLAPRLGELPAPAISLGLRAVGLGPPAADQLKLSIRGTELRRRHLAAAVREVRAAQGADALLKVLPVDSASRFPERRAMLTPFPAR